MSNQLLSILLPLNVSRPLTYRNTTSLKLQVGQIVEVPIKNKSVIGCVVEEVHDLPDFQIRDISNVYEGQILSANMLQFMRWVANYNVTSAEAIFKMVLGGNKKLDKSFRSLMTDLSTIKTITLSTEQNTAFQSIKERLSNNQHSVTLIDGVTGSGKTELYLECLSNVIKRGGQALILLPEITLATQLIKRFESTLGIKPVVWHSGISQSLKYSYWHNIRLGNAQFIVGARSALFLPFAHLKLIIVDEEHDSSFKQEEGVTYNARDMAIVKAKIDDIPILLASATPSIETAYNVQSGRYHKVFLQSRYGEAVFPLTQVIDLNKEHMRHNMWISPTLRQQLINTLNLKKQSLLFLNRRGYAPITICAKCKHKIECTNCNSFMVEHKKKGVLQCHYCSHTIDKVTECPVCDSSAKMIAFGPGVERIAEEVQKAIPNARVEIFTSDTIQNHQDAQQKIDSIIKGDIDIIVGTQLTAKGLHFPGLHLVGIIECDKKLNGGDVRALERTYQLFQQVSGRAGRESTQGVVYIQTYEPESMLINQIISGDREAFYATELNDRKVAEMPPFAKLALITVQAFDESTCAQTADLLSSHIPEYHNITILGPTPAPIFMVRKRYRYRFLVKSPSNINMQKIIRQWLTCLTLPKTVQVKVDIDPHSFL
ncbi:primosomal protein N' [Rickettsiales endosymbiont of Peranema trichophorum]|uniref:replication restart helicase PriA n=1 Tax=Rickettsiales endosymbiont of Peranema trichophorum TaxID=2486577 RepID=UPI0010237640|nr:primosomal protein N' [Rickettsiales endosymbiont of Peranema trichophorum]RZI46337.1 primosomal protein N' [Rickettsiales endosymbiont of Peranema trichophorum]